MCDLIDDIDLGEQQRSRIAEFATRLVKACGIDESAVLCVRITGSDVMRALNRDFRGVDAPTDVLSFSASQEGFPQPVPVLGDIVLCWPVITENASEAERSAEIECYWALTHGLLHILGWDHSDESSLADMQIKTWELLEQCGVDVKGA